MFYKKVHGKNKSKLKINKNTMINGIGIEKREKKSHRKRQTKSITQIKK